ncbi:MAG: polysaccharide biosynthesis protein [Lachnospiraceae bacterium]|jgi:FlaA1/EpsC-like NDP-sugar epimerase|nr:polysaccharide biosynthesis protein [Lachnospiraceae bacterium]
MKEKKSFNVKILYRRAWLIGYDIISVVLASYLALLLRFDSYKNIPEHFILPINNFLPINIVLTLFVFYVFRLYHSLWAYAGETELQNIVMACGVSAFLGGLGLQFFRIGEQAVPNSYYIFYAFLLIAFVFSSRFSYRFLRGIKHKAINKRNTVSVMVVGAGEAANVIIKEIVNSNFSTMVIRCIIDDDMGKWGRFIQGIKVIGGREKIIECADIYNIDEIIVAMPSISRTELTAILDVCKETACKLRVLPGMYQLVSGEVSVSTLRDVELEDLLGREPIEVDLDSILGYVRGKKVLVTGGGGTIGSELCRQIAAKTPSHLIALDIYENGIYDVQQELLVAHPDLHLTVLIASVRNTNRINQIFAEYQPDIVYHAAAHKHVPLMEDSPGEAIKNNVFGTYKTAMAAATHGAKRFVMISTDKAVNPTNVMGASKRICEMIVQSFNKKYATEFVAVRFGNVLGSSGSVIPLFKKQIAEGGPVTVTHPEIIRYFMTIPEAVSLVLQAGAYARGGEIFVLDMGKPVKILDLARNLISLSGFRPDEDIKIEFTGLRPGEKLFEELLLEEEGMKETANRLIYIGKPIDFDEERFFKKLEELRETSENESPAIREMICEIVPTYQLPQAF